MHQSTPPSRHRHTQQWQIATEEQTRLLAAALADCLRAQPPDSHRLHINLHGSLGAGKTTFTRCVLRALGISGRIKSPSYAIAELYRTPAGIVVHHFDFYRFSDPQEWEDAGFREPFAEAGLKLVEWPDKAQPMLPTADIDLHISTQPDHGRDFTATAHTHTGRNTLDVWNYPPSGT